MGTRTDSSFDVEMAYVRALLQGGGPADAIGQNALALRATAHIRDKRKAAMFAEQLVVAIGFHHLLAGMSDAPVGPCREAVDILAEIEVANG